MMGRLSDYVCVQPFNYVEIYGPGIGLCCPNWLTKSVADGWWQSPREAFNSDSAQEIRESIHDGSFRFCTACPYINDGVVVENNGTVFRKEEAPPWLRKIVRKRKTKIDPAKVPLRALAGYDRTCNLCCPSCRVERIVTKGERLAKAKEYQDFLLEDFYPSLKALRVAGDGDSFASPVYWDLLKKLDKKRFPELRLTLNTNGLMFTPKTWAQIGMREDIEGVVVSVDAATAPTYKALRGGSWYKLDRNLRFMSLLKEHGFLKSVILNFVVQKGNWREMKDFVDLGVRLGVTGLCFIGMRHWDFMPRKYYRENAVCQPRHPEHEEFRAFLDDPVFQRDKDPWVSLDTDVWKA